MAKKAEKTRRDKKREQVDTDEQKEIIKRQNRHSKKGKC